MTMLFSPRPPIRKINFSAGPAALPHEVLVRARHAVIDFETTCMSVLSQSHRGPAYERVQAKTIAMLRELLAVPVSHDILLLGGSARLQFAMLPMNLITRGTYGSYVITGLWSRAAYDEAARVGHARIALDVREPDGTYRRVPTPRELRTAGHDRNAAYLHICSNNTVYGTQWPEFPLTDETPLVADMTSDLLSRVIDVSQFGLIYAAAQKNLGPAGVVVVIIRKDLLERGRRDIPAVLRYATHAQNASLYATPPMFAVAIMRYVLEYALSIGGVKAIEATNREKARRLYAAIDARPELYRTPAMRNSRSMMNVTFRLPSPDDDARFLAEATHRGMVGLAGHRTAGGIRASIYNWVPLEDVDKLVELIAGFGKPLPPPPPPPPRPPSKKRRSSKSRSRTPPDSAPAP